MVWNMRSLLSISKIASCCDRIDEILKEFQELIGEKNAYLKEVHF